MRLQAIIDIIKGELVNSPSINYFSKIRLNPAKVEREDLFIARSTSDIIQAIEHGAYGVVYEGECLISDSEVAFIRVDSISVALNALFRYFVVSKNVETLKAKHIEYDLLKNFVKDSRFVFVDKYNYLHVFEKLSVSETPRCFVFYDDSFANTIFPNFFFFKGREHTKAKYITTSMFYTNLEYEESQHSFEILEFYTCELIGVIGFLETRKIEFKLKDHLELPSLNFTYIDSFNKEVKKGKSEKVLIFVYDENEDVYEYVRENAKWATVKHSYGMCIEEVIDSIKNEKFNFYIIYKFKRTKILPQIIKKEIVEGSLF